MSENYSDITVDGGVLVFECPHCRCIIQVEINQINCSIFRHAYYFMKNEQGHIILTQQLNPHAPKNVCDELVEQGKVVGCAKPFRLVNYQGGFRAVVCDYI